MSFAHYEYLPFLLIVLALFQFVPARARIAFLLAASYAFYAALFPAHALLLVASTLLDYGVGLALGSEQRRGRRKALLLLSLILNLGALAIFKYSGLALETLNDALRLVEQPPLSWRTLVLPLGISFYTFQTVGYTLDVYARRIEPCRSLPAYALYVAFFPQLVAGPIERAQHLLPQLRDTRRLDGEAWGQGARLVAWGLLKKWALADRLQMHVGERFLEPAGQDSLSLLTVGLCLSAVIYLDFSAYTDIARGSARWFGVRLVRNFDRPFLATSIFDQARRWHMSLGSWMQDYVYLPLSRGRPGYFRLWRANLIVMGLFGLWHGASWTFLVWGLAYGVMLAVHQSGRLHAARLGVRGRPQPTRLRALLGWGVTVLVAAQLIVMFFAPDLRLAGEFYRAELACRLPSSWAQLRWSLVTLALLGVALVFHGAGLWWNLERAWQRLGPVGRALWPLTLLALAIALRPAQALPFIYFRF